jgi:hypothetical protein
LILIIKCPYFSIAINLLARKPKAKINDSQMRAAVHGRMTTAATPDVTQNGPNNQLFHKKAVTPILHH